jgi:hypothetical protein
MMVVPDSCKQLPVEPYRASRKSCRLLGANALTSLKNTGRHNATAYANAVPDGARPDFVEVALTDSPNNIAAAWHTRSENHAWALPDDSKAAVAW